MPGGRPPKGLGLIEGLAGSLEAKARLRAVLETLMGLKTIHEASEEVGLSEAMLHVERAQALQGALSALEPKPMGRPRKRKEIDLREHQRVVEQQAELREEMRKLQAKVDYREALGGRRGEKAAEKKTKASARGS